MVGSAGTLQTSSVHGECRGFFGVAVSGNKFTPNRALGFRPVFPRLEYLHGRWESFYEYRLDFARYLDGSL